MVFFSICHPPGLLPVLRPLEWYMTPTLDGALLSSSRAGADMGRTIDNLSITERLIRLTQWDSIHRSPELTLKLNARVAP